MAYCNLHGTPPPGIRVVEFDPEFDPWDSAVQFTLTFDGPLRSGHSATAEQKHAMRRRFHAQMKRVWDVHPVLQNWRVSEVELARQRGDIRPAFIRPPVPEEQRPLWRDVLSSSFVGANGYQFVPLVRPDLHLACGIEIDLLVNREKNQPDLDNIQKTLFDALKMPHPTNDKIFFYTPPSESEVPFFCLLQDDKLVTHVQHRIDDLPLPLDGKAYKNSEARCTLRVSLNPTMLTDDNFRFSQGNIIATQAPTPSFIARTENTRGLSTGQLRLRTSDLAARMRALETELDRIARHYEDQQLRPASESERQALFDGRTALIRQLREYKDARWRTEILPEAKAIASELGRRLGVDLAQISGLHSIEWGNLAGASPLDGAAGALENLARQLPNEED